MDTDTKNIMTKAWISIKSCFTGIGQVMFQQSALTGLLFFLGIAWGAYECHQPQVVWGALVGVVASTVAGYLFVPGHNGGTAGLWGFNGVLVGCAFPTFLGDTWLMWLALVLCAMLSTWVRTGFNNMLAPNKVNSLTFPFVFLTWLFLLAARYMDSLPITGLSIPSLAEKFSYSLDVSFGSLVIYWLKGISQIFLINSWVTGIFFLVGLAVCSKRAAIWAAIGSAVSLAIAILYKAAPSDIANGLFGFSPVLTAIALGSTFNSPGLRTAVWTLLGIIATVFIQAGMDAFFEPLGMPTLTGPFCVATWLFLLPHYRMGQPEFLKNSHPEWSSDWTQFVDDLKNNENKLKHN